MRLPAPAARRLRSSLVPDSRAAVGTGPQALELFDATEGGLHLGRGRAAAARVGLHVQRRLDVGLEVLEERLELLQHHLRVLFHTAADSLEELADLTLLVPRAATERELRPESFADFLEELFESAPRFRRRTVHVSLGEPLGGARKDSTGRVLRGAGAAIETPGSDLETFP